jgi:hypothetical protein
MMMMMLLLWGWWERGELLVGVEEIVKDASSGRGRDVDQGGGMRRGQHWASIARCHPATSTQKLAEDVLCGADRRRGDDDLGRPLSRPKRGLGSQARLGRGDRENTLLPLRALARQQRTRRPASQPTACPHHARAHRGRRARRARRGRRGRGGGCSCRGGRAEAVCVDSTSKGHWLIVGGWVWVHSRRKMKLVDQLPGLVRQRPFPLRRPEKVRKNE